MEGYQERVTIEKLELSEKLNKLRAFMEDAKEFKSLPREDQVLLKCQYSAMVMYESILRIRFESFSR